jgi:hypothetical protein
LSCLMIFWSAGSYTGLCQSESCFAVLRWNRIAPLLEPATTALIHFKNCLLHKFITYKKTIFFRALNLAKRLTLRSGRFITQKFASRLNWLENPLCSYIPRNYIVYHDIYRF